VDGPDLDEAEIVSHYAAGLEQSRLASWGRLEFLRTTEILRRYLPRAAATIADVGGGPGAYALALAADGHRVHLLDPVALHVEQARIASSHDENSELASAEVGDARELPWREGTIDVVMLLGPLYHLTLADDRLRALAEARRVLRCGGLLIAAAISRFASTFEGLRWGFLAEPEFRAIVERDVRDGQHRNPTGRPEWFTTAYFHRPGELADELQLAGFELDSLLAVEGPAGWFGKLEWWLEDPDRLEILLASIRGVEAEPSLLGASAHLLAVARKP
jgi:ubiquinone/menaquinone biosynthesis C-methylase UbiE